MNRSDDIALLRRAAELLTADATDLRHCHNVNPHHPDWEDERNARAMHDEALTIAVGLHLLAKRIEGKEDDIEKARRLT